MKKLIAISVVFALVAGVAFAVDLGAKVIGNVNVIDVNSAHGSSVKGSAELKAVRISGAAEVADGTFGGFIRIGNDAGGGWHGVAWWKPIDQLKIGIGGDPDGIWGQSGFSGWGFTPYGASDSVAYTGDHVWGGVKLNTRKAFYDGLDYDSFFIEIKPVDMVSINIALPFPFSGDAKLEDIFKGTIAQVALNLSFGNFAFTFTGKDNATYGMKASQVFGYFNLSAIENLTLGFGLGADFLPDTPIYLGLLVGYERDTWGVRFRSVIGIPVNPDKQDFGMLFDVLPYFVINENFSVFVNTGVRFEAIPKTASVPTDWHINPYIQVGDMGWGPKFYAGLDVSGNLSGGDVHFKLPIGIQVGF